MVDNIRVLYVDDEPDLLDLGKIFLENSGEFFVRTIDSAFAALKLLKTEKYDAIISDYQMSGMDGIQFLIEVRKHFGKIPFILFTGKGREEIVIQAINNGADFYLQKGGNADAQFAELSHQVKHAVSRKRAEEELTTAQILLKETFEQSPVPMVLVSMPDGIIRIVNSACREFLGLLDEPSPINTQLISFKPSYKDFDSQGNERTIEDSPIARALSGQKTSNVEGRIVRKDGTVSWELVNGTPIYNAKGEIIAGYLILTDITERKFVEELVRMSEAKLQLALLASDIGMWELDIPTMTGVIDEKAAQILGYQKKKDIGSHSIDWDLLSHPDDIPLINKRLTNYLEGLEPFFESEHRMRHSSGEWIWVVGKGKITSRPLNGSRLRITGTLQDVTKRKKIELELISYRDRLKELHHFAHIGTFELILETNTVTWSEEMFNISGRDPLLPAPSYAELPCFFTDASWDRLISIAKMALSTHEKFNIELEFIRPDGSIRLTNAFVGIKSDTKGNIIGFHGTVQDITEYRQARIALEASEEKFRQSEYKYRTLIENSTDVVFTVDKDGRYQFVNNVFASTFGSTPDFFIEKSFWDIYPKEHADQRFEAVTRVFQTGREVSVEVAVPLPDKTLWFLATLNPVKDDKGNVTQVLAHSKDITDRKEAEEALHQSVQLFREIINNANDAIFLLERTPKGPGKYLLVNDKAIRMLGYSEKELLEISPRDIVPGDMAKKIIPDVIKKLLKDGHATFESAHRRKDGSIYPIEVSTHTFRYKGKDVDLSIVRDITERKRSEDALRKANKKLTILSSITRHDINNQLMVLMGYINILEKKQTDPSLSEYFRNAKNTSQRISAMIQFTREYESIGINAPSWQECHKLVDNAKKQIQLMQIKVENDLPSSAEVFADLLIGKVFYNLIDNAVRHSGKITTIRFSMEESGDSHLIICEDDGEGIPVENKEEIFERGFGKNSGLGLTLVREILDITGITIRETGEPGKGARFEITVPDGKWRLETENR